MVLPDPVGPQISIRPCGDQHLFQFRQRLRLHAEGDRWYGFYRGEYAHHHVFQAVRRGYGRHAQLNAGRTEALEVDAPVLRLASV